MEDFLSCDVCGKPANVHLTQVMNGQMVQIHLCESCAHKQGLTILKEFLAKQFSGELHQAKIYKTSKSRFSSQTCPKCHYNAHLLKKSKRLGCAECYQHIPNIAKYVDQSHKKTIYRGKCPPNILQRQNAHKQILSLEQQMRLAVNEERYEDAANHRDELKKVKCSDVFNNNTNEILQAIR